MGSSFDVSGYLRRRADELVEGLRTDGGDSRTASAHMAGAVRALEATGHLDRTAGAGILAEFERRLEDEGFVERVEFSAGVEATVTAAGGEAARRPRPQPRVPEVEGVVAVDRAVEVPGPGQLVLLSVVRWSTHVDLQWAWITPQGEGGGSAQRSSPQPPGVPWRFDAWDDVGTRYRSEGTGGGGGAMVTSGATTMKPRVPDEAAQLTIVVRELDSEVEVASVAIDLA